MSTLFPVWTIIENKTAVYSSYTAEVSVHACAPLTVPTTLQTWKKYVTDKETLVGSKQTTEAYNRMMKKRKYKVGSWYTNKPVGIGVIARANEPNLRYEAIQNGVIFVFPRSNLLEPARYYYNEKTAYDIPRTEYEEDLAVHVWPLSVVAMGARTAIQCESTRATDFRAFYVYGEHYNTSWHTNYYNGENYDPAKEWSQPVYGITRHKHKSCTDQNPRKMIVVVNGKQVTYEDVCMKDCPRKLMWSTGQCAFMTYNCIYGTELNKAASKNDKPNYNAFFGPNYKLPKDSILRTGFDRKWADNLVKSEVARKAHDEAQQENVERGARHKQLTRQMCAGCKLQQLEPRKRATYRSQDESKHSPCDSRPDSCKGPFRTRDYIEGKPTYEPWELHMLALRKSAQNVYDVRQVPLKAFKHKIHELRLRRANLSIVRPYRRESMNLTLLYACWTPAAKRSNAKRLVLLTNATRNETTMKYIVTYGECCAALGVKQVNSWKQLHKQFAWSRRITPEVHEALNSLLASNTLWRVFGYTGFTVTDSYVEYRVQQGWGSNLKNLASAKSIYQNHLQYSLAREKVTNHMRAMILDPEVNFQSVPHYDMIRAKYATNGEIRNALLKKTRAKKLPLFDAPSPCSAKCQVGGEQQDGTKTKAACETCVGSSD